MNDQPSAEETQPAAARIPMGRFRNPAKWILRWLLKGAALAVILAVTVLLVWAFGARSKPELQIWHTESLEEEFTARDADSVTTLKAYLEQEDRLFRELHEKIYNRLEHTDLMTFSRYRVGGPQDPESLPRNWNRTFELVPENIQGGALLLHGLTDSPYSLRRIGEILHEKGFYVLGLRMPAHGTIPEALTTVRWEDWMAASRIGARHVREQIGPDAPFVIAGYSNGGGLAVKYSLDALSDPSLPSPDRLLLFSPEIGITPLAAISNSHKLFSFIPYFEKSKWLDIVPEYDPFKYNSFPKNASQEAYDVTAALLEQIDEARAAGRFGEFPPVLAFLSWIDATVRTPVTINRLYGKLQNEGSELVIFDVNRFDRLAFFIPEADDAPLEHLEARSDLPYRLTVIGNEAGDSRTVAVRTKASLSATMETTPLEAEWPPGVYSLSHVGIPFPEDDPVYGVEENTASGYGGIPLGRLQPRGENGLLTAPLSLLMRLRCNPFFFYVEQRVVEEIEGLTGDESKPID